MKQPSSSNGVPSTVREGALPPPSDRAATALLCAAAFCLSFAHHLLRATREPLLDMNCPINKPEKYYPAVESGCP